METIMIFGSDYNSVSAFHDGLIRVLSLPDYYGKNADALHDCLSERRNPVKLWLGDRGEGEVSGAVDTLVQIIEEVGGSVKEI